VLVFVHELGHYIAARACGIYVEAFSIGFGPAMASWTARSGTVWKVCVLPLGGYVKMHGMSVSTIDEAKEDEAVFRDGEAYFQKSVWKRMIVAAAGPAANFVLAVVLFSALYGAIGQEVPLPVIGQVQAGSAAAQAGLQANDEIRAVDGVAVSKFEDLRKIVAGSPNKALSLSVHRGTQDLILPVHIAATGPNGSDGRLGVTSGRNIRISLNPLQAIAAGGAQTWDVLRQTVAGLSHIVSSGQGADQLGGPLMIARLSGQVAQLGVASLVNFIALLSVNLGLVNLLPIPILDGGHLLFYVAEALRGRPVPPRAQEYGYRVGFAIIASLFVFVSWNDLVHAGAFKWVAHLVG
jgi:regulator of sigma E protease